MFDTRFTKEHFWMTNPLCIPINESVRGGKHQPQTKRNEINLVLIKLYGKENFNFPMPRREGMLHNPMDLLYIVYYTYTRFNLLFFGMPPFPTPLVNSLKWSGRGCNTKGVNSWRWSRVNVYRTDFLLSSISLHSTPTPPLGKKRRHFLLESYRWF